MATVVYCDVCGKDQPKGDSDGWLKVRVFNPRELRNARREQTPGEQVIGKDYDLCLNCGPETCLDKHNKSKEMENLLQQLADRKSRDRWADFLQNEYLDEELAKYCTYTQEVENG